MLKLAICDMITVDIIVTTGDAMTTDAFTVRTEQETIEKLNTMAKSMDRSRNWLVNQALEAYLEEQQWFANQVQAGRDSIARGEGTPHEEAMTELRSHIHGKHRE